MAALALACHWVTDRSSDIVRRPQDTSLSRRHALANRTASLILRLNRFISFLSSAWLSVSRRASVLCLTEKGTGSVKMMLGHQWSADCTSGRLIVPDCDLNSFLALIAGHFNSHGGLRAAHAGRVRVLCVGRAISRTWLSRMLCRAVSALQ